jgi:hypothetical protein
MKTAKENSCTNKPAMINFSPVCNAAKVPAAWMPPPVGGISDVVYRFEEYLTCALEQETKQIASNEYLREPLLLDQRVALSIHEENDAAEDDIDRCGEKSGCDENKAIRELVRIPFAKGVRTIYRDCMMKGPSAQRPSCERMRPTNPTVSTI